MNMLHFTPYFSVIIRSAIMGLVLFIAVYYSFSVREDAVREDVLTEEAIGNDSIPAKEETTIAHLGQLNNGEVSISDSIVLTDLKPLHKDSLSAWLLDIGADNLLFGRSISDHNNKNYTYIYFLNKINGSAYVDVERFDISAYDAFGKVRKENSNIIKLKASIFINQYYGCLDYENSKGSNIIILAEAENKRIDTLQVTGNHRINVLLMYGEKCKKCNSL